MRVPLLASAALAAFAANSILTRSALAAGQLDAASFSLIRVATGALALAVLIRLRRPTVFEPAASWDGAWSLSGYLVLFTLAYTWIGASIGALLLFGAVQVTMIATGIARGERLAATDWMGGLLALAGLIWLTVPGATAPDFTGALLMVGAGICWGAYSISGRRSRDPLRATSRNFLRSALLLALPLGVLAWPPTGTASGVALAAASGAVASGLGYTVWYAVLPSLSSVRAATIQLAVPVVTAAAAALLLGEVITVRLMGSALCVAAGVWLTTSRRR